MIFRKIFLAVLSAFLTISFSYSVLASESEKKHQWSISKEDFKHIRNADYHANRSRWNDAILHAKKSSDPDIYKLFFWRMLISGRGNPRFSDVTEFIRENPDWPRIDKLRRRVEEALLDDSASSEEIIEWFTRKKSRSGNIVFDKPVTNAGKRLLAEALIDHSKKISDSGYKLTLEEVNRTEIDEFIRESWVESDFTAKEEWAFLARHKDRLRQKDYVERINRLLWDRKTASAKRILSFIEGDYKNLFEARIKLRTQKFGLDKVLDSVPNYLKDDQGLLYDRIKWREKNSTRESAAELLLDVPRHIKYPQKWWSMREKYINEFIKDKKYESAYKLAAEHGFKEDLVRFAEAEWKAGWIALRYMDDARAAYRHFYKIYHKVTTPISLGRASYWAGRAAEKNKNQHIAKKWYTVASKFPTSFYGQLATEKMGRTTLYLPRQPIPTWADINQYNNNKLVKVAYILNKLGRHYQAREFIKHAVEIAKTKGEQMMIAEFGLSIGRMDYSIVAAKEATRKEGVLLVDLHYPLLDSLKDTKGREIKKPEKALIHSIAMQESIFDKRARSHAGALGLMQLMPPTAKETAINMGLGYSKKRLTSDSRYNLSIGSRYLSDLIRGFKGSYILGIAAYNGGGGNVRKWIKANGDPRKYKDVDSVIDWIEKIPFKETQNYVQRVIENVQLYRYVLDKDSPPFVKTSQDIIR